MSKQIDINAVSPKAGPQFSPNLYAWLKKNGRGSNIQIFRLKTDGYMNAAGTLFIGYIQDGELIGSNLWLTLCLGARSKVYCHTQPLFVLVPNFWTQYMKLGRCFIDSKHEHSFIDKRWEESALRRTCLWCGCVQKKVKTRRTIIDTTWVKV